MAKKQPVVVYEDQVSIEATRSKAYGIGSVAGKVIGEFNKVGLKEFEPADFVFLLNDAEGYIKALCLEKIGETETIGGFKTKKTALLDQLELPDISALQSAVNALKIYLGWPTPTFHLLSDFEIDGDKVTPIEDLLEARLNGFRIIATEEHEVEADKAYKEFIRAFKALNDLMAKRSIGTRLQHRQVTSYLTLEGEDVAFNAHFYRELV
jgi:hypothetical protein